MTARRLPRSPRGAAEATAPQAITVTDPPGPAGVGSMGAVIPGALPPADFPAEDPAEELARRVRLLRTARSDRHIVARQALTELREVYRLSLPLIERRWGMMPGWL